jgi:chromosome segregation ATPase
MIARTVSLTVRVKNVADARAALDAVMAREQGYAAQLTFSTPEAGARSLQASLRVPAGQLGTALDALRRLGRVEEETQSGEEVTQQHADLVARLTNAREEEARLRALLAQRTGKIEDVLQVEEEIARVRGEIEGMEAQQRGLEHRVDFASVDLKLVEEYTAQLGSPAEGTGTRVHNAFVAGVRNAGGSLLGLLLFVEEYGPVLAIWGVLLGLPAWVVWRRYSRARANLM